MLTPPAPNRDPLRLFCVHLPQLLPRTYPPFVPVRTAALAQTAPFPLPGGVAWAKYALLTLLDPVDAYAI